MRPWLAIAALIVALDQLSKWAALAWLAPHAPLALAPFLNLTLTFNRGAAFGFLSAAPGWQNALFIAIAVVAAAVIVHMLRGLKPGERWLAFGLALILGGALGNLVDRLVHGYVIDFIDFHVAGWHFWTFNVADSAISIGAALLVVDALRSRAPA
jgi:signal peptidase II